MKIILDVSTLESREKVDRILRWLRTMSSEIIHSSITRYERTLRDDTGETYRVEDSNGIVEGVVSTLLTSIINYVNVPAQWEINFTTADEVLASLSDTIVVAGERINEVAEAGEDVYVSINDVKLLSAEIVDTVPIYDILDAEAISEIEKVYQTAAKRCADACRQELDLLMSRLGTLRLPHE